MSTKFKQYFFLAINEEERQAYLLGYKLKLTPTEFKIVNILMDTKYATVDRLLLDLPARCTRKSIPVHITAINKKAHDISGRKLIENSREGYYFAENI